MKRILKWLGIAVGGLAGLAVVLAITVYVLSEREIRRQYTHVPIRAFSVPGDPASVEKGRRLAAVYGCLNCHGDRLQGLKIHDEPAFARIVAPNLTRAVREYSDAELERVIRRGVRRTGISNWVMPSAMYSRMSDEDLRNVIAFLRSSSSVQDGPAADITMGPLGRIGIVTGKFKPVVSQIPPGLRPAVTTVRGDPLAFGEYLVKTACSECHGQDLKGDEFLKAPALTVLAGYSDEAFRHLMKTGRGLGDRKLGLMTQAGAARFPHLTDDELEAMSLFLKQQFGGLAKAGESSATAARTERRGPDRS